MIIYTTSHGAEISSDTLISYLDKLVGKFYKIIPMTENQERSVEIYTDSLQAEIEGLISSMNNLNQDPLYISLLAVSQWINTHISNCEFKKLRREVFHAIDICNKIKAQYVASLEYRR